MVGGRMNILFNQQQKSVAEGSLVIDLLVSQGLSKRVAVWVNQQRLLQQEYATRQLEEGDQVKVIKPLGGG